MATKKNYDEIADAIDRYINAGEAPPTDIEDPGAFIEQPKVKLPPAIDWSALEGRTPPEREWAINYWLGMGHVTLCAGPPGSGKTGVAQALGSCLALRREYLDWIPQERRVLMWACEDDVNELWRRQLAISKWLGTALTDFNDKFFLHSYDGEQVELAGLVDQRHLVPSLMLDVLRQQIGDYKADVVILDNIARLFGGNENDRHQVTSFVAMLTNAIKPTNAAMLLLGHPAKAAGSEYSGSTAWEGAVRARWYLGRTLPDQNDADEGERSDESDDKVRYLCRRKANYSDRDWRRVTYQDGAMVPDAAPDPALRTGPALSDQYRREAVARAIRQLASMKEYGVSSTASPSYLPKLAARFKLLDRMSERQFAETVTAMRKDGEVVVGVVGQYKNRTTKEGLVMADDAAAATAQMGSV